MSVDVAGEDASEAPDTGRDDVGVAGMTVAEMTQPNPVRLYDFFLGGKDNYEVDRKTAAQLQQVFPTVSTTVRHNRDFMVRATRYLAGTCGVRQFLDIGTGIPAEPNLHQVAQDVAVDARVVYCDKDPVVLAYARALMIGTEQGVLDFVLADVREPDSILSSRELVGTLDLSEPVALSLVAVLDYLPEGSDPHGVVRQLMAALAPGSFLVVSHATADYHPDMRRASQYYNDNGMTLVTRDRAEFARFFTGLELLDPGVTGPHRWRPDTPPPAHLDAAVSMYAAVARKP